MEFVFFAVFAAARAFRKELIRRRRTRSGFSQPRVFTLYNLIDKVLGPENLMYKVT